MRTGIGSPAHRRPRTNPEAPASDEGVPKTALVQALLAFRAMSEVSVRPPLRAPWTPEQVAALNEWQVRPDVPQFTCGENSAHVLIATRFGWRCPYDTYEQDWAHAFMASFAEHPPRDLLT